MKTRTIVLTILFVVTGYSLYGQTVVHPWHVVDRGGGTSTGGTLTLIASVGQTSTEMMSTVPANLESGYIPGLRPFWGETSIELNMAARWNMISVPLDVGDSRKSVLFPTAISQAFGYAGSYKVYDTLLPGKGYWLKFASAQTVTQTGYQLDSLVVPVNKGWNMIGSLSVPLPVSNITSDPPGIITSKLFGYKGGYTGYDTVMPGKGYWLKANSAGTLILSSGHSLEMLAKSAIKIVPTNELPPLPPDESAAKELAVPKEYGLEQSYPNPFNPATTIKYQLPADSKVTMRIYNILGQVVATLADEIQSAGYKSVEWDGSNFASGVYFYRIVAEAIASDDKGNLEMKGHSFVSVKKMLLIR